MSMWIVLAALATIAITAGLTLILVRMNTPQEERGRRRSDGGVASGGYDHDSSANGGGDGGGD